MRIARPLLCLWTLAPGELGVAELRSWELGVGSWEFGIGHSAFGISELPLGVRNQELQISQDILQHAECDDWNGIRSQRAAAERQRAIASPARTLNLIRGPAAFRADEQ